MSVLWQPTLFGTGDEPTVDDRFTALTRRELDDASWVDHAPGWLAGADEVFATLVEVAPWRQHDRLMYGRQVTEPRLHASWKDGAVRAAVPVIDVARRILSSRYHRDLDTGGLNLYRDGRDSVAWHRDRIPNELTDPVVAIVSLGTARALLLRPYGGGPSIRYDLQPGDLLVTGGATQRRWEHTVPKVASAGPRISITFRHTEGLLTGLGGNEGGARG